jgi:hypothetical protein
VNRSLRLGRHMADERCRAASGLVGAERVLGLGKTVDRPVAEFEDWLWALAEHALPLPSEQLAVGFGLAPSSTSIQGFSPPVNLIPEALPACQTRFSSREV